MLKKILIVCSIVLAVVVTPVVAKHGSSDSHGSKSSKHKKGSHGSKDKSSHGSKGKHGSKGSHGNHGSSDNTCDTYTKKADKAYTKYLKYNKKYTSCQSNASEHGSSCKKKKHDSKGEHGSKGSHGSSNNPCKKYKKKADKAYKKYLSYEAKRKQECQTNLPPVAFDQNITTPEDTNSSIILTGTESNGQLLTYLVLTQPTHGTLSGTSSSLTYTPNANYVGNDTFTFKVNNGTLDSNIATLSIVVTPVNDVPVAQEQNLTLVEDSNISMLLTGTDIDGDTLTYRVTTQPSNGTLSGTAPNLVYTPNANYFGNDSFTFVVNDGTVDSIDAIVSLVITPVNDTPVAVDDNITIQEKEPVTIQPLLNDYDLDGNTSKLRIISITSPEFGAILLDNNHVYYSPKSKNATLDSLTYTIADEYNATSTATITIHIIPVNDAPIAFNQTIETNEEQAISFELNGTDPDGDDINYTLAYTQYVPEHGTLSGNAPNLLYTPNTNYSGEDYIVFKVDDGELESSMAVVKIIVHPLNDPPVAIAGNDTIVKRGDTVVIDGSKSYDLDGNITSYEWKEGNTILSTEKYFSQVFYDEGVHTLILTVIDDQNTTDSDEKVITINPCCEGCVYPDPTDTNPFN